MSMVPRCVYVVGEKDIKATPLLKHKILSSTSNYHKYHACSALLLADAVDGVSGILKHESVVNYSFC